MHSFTEGVNTAPPVKQYLLQIESKNKSIILTNCILHEFPNLLGTQSKHYRSNMSKTHRLEHSGSSKYVTSRSHDYCRRENLVSTRSSQITQSKPSTLTFTLRMLRQVVEARSAVRAWSMFVHGVLAPPSLAPLCGNVDATPEPVGLLNVLHCSQQHYNTILDGKL